MSERRTGWAFVAAQAALLGLLIALPGADDYRTPAWLRTAADVSFWFGVLLAVVAALSLGRSLTATPVPTATSDLRTTGPYRFVRHPIYTGVIVIVVAMSVQSGRFVTVAVGVITLAFFHVKAAWEERRLIDRYPGYAAYAASTPRFVPRVWQRSTEKINRRT